MPDIRVKYASRALMCRLTRQEHLDRGQSLASTIHAIGDEERRQKEAKERMKEAMTGLEEEAGRLARIVQEGQEERQVRVRFEFDYDKGRVTVIREDTGEEVESRSMNDTERQMTLPAVEVVEH